MAVLDESQVDVLTELVDRSLDDLGIENYPTFISAACAVVDDIESFLWINDDDRVVIVNLVKVWFPEIED